MKKMLKLASGNADYGDEVTMTHPLKWLKLRRLTIPSIGEDVGLEFSYVVKGKVK